MTTAAHSDARKENRHIRSGRSTYSVRRARRRQRGFGRLSGSFGSIPASLAQV